MYAKRRKKHQDLPVTGPAREALREKGQFWTPDWVASAMVQYVRPSSTGHLFDPAAGACSFFRACKHQVLSGVTFYGCDIDLSSLSEATSAGIDAQDLRGVEQRDFVLDPPSYKFMSIVANPPYIRHHRLSHGTKQALRLISRTLIGKDLDGRAGLHVYFLIRALDLLAHGGRLAFIIPGDTFEGVFANTLWEWITRNYVVDAVVTFSGDATPFPGVDTNTVIVFIRNAGATSRLIWGRCTEADGPALAGWVSTDFQGHFPGDVFVRELEEALRTGLSRPPRAAHDGPSLGTFASVMRGIATGDNDFFFLNSQEITNLGISDRFFVRAVGRTRDATRDRITVEHLAELDRSGRPTFLLSLGNADIDTLPRALQTYLRKGEERGVNKRTLVATRRPWYRMEKRSTPPLLFAYLGRRNARFILNEAGVVPLTGFLCIYAKPGVDCVALWHALNHPQTLQNLRLVAKSYGSDAIKVEPRALERLPILESVAAQFGLGEPSETPKQPSLAFAPA
jgi:adenine-specific DNA-methyltransferase